jgi:membrane-associated phospholipid phosphatase
VASRRAAAGVFIGYNLLLALLWAGVGLKHPLHPVNVIAFAAAMTHLAAVSFPGLLESTVLGDSYPAFAVMGIWTEMGLILPRLHPDGAPLRDAAALRLDAMLFGTHWHTEWIARMPWAWLSGLMYFAYCSYYALLIGLPVALWFLRQREALANLAFRLLLVYTACAICYLIFPVIGPAPVPPVADAVRHGFFFDVTAAVQRAGDSLGTSLPSTHAAGSMTIALAGWRWLPRPVAIAVTVQAIAIALSTVYTQNHYAIDAVAGVLLAAFLQTVIAPVLMGEVRVSRRRSTAVATA